MPFVVGCVGVGQTIGCRLPANPTWSISIRAVYRRDRNSVVGPVSSLIMTCLAIAFATPYLPQADPSVSEEREIRAHTVSAITRGILGEFQGERSSPTFNADFDPSRRAMALFLSGRLTSRVLSASRHCHPFEGIGSHALTITAEETEEGSLTPSHFIRSRNCLGTRNVLAPYALEPVLCVIGRLNYATRSG